MTTRSTLAQRRARQIGAVLLIALTLAALVAELLTTTGTWRLVLTMAFVAIAPGWAVVGYARDAPLAFRWGVGVALSIGIGMITGQVMLLLHLWHPRAAVLLLGVLTLVPLTHHLLRETDREVRG